MAPRTCACFARAMPHAALNAAADSRGFLQSHKNKASTFGVTVNLAPLADPDPTLQSLLERLEDARATAEKTAFDQARF